MKGRFLATGTEPYVTNPAQFADLIAADGKRWSAVIRKANVRAQ